MKAVVTGGAGFIGSHLCKNLLDDGYDVVCIDNLCTGSRSNIEHLEGDQFTFIEHDICEPLLEIDGIDEVYNLACPASPADFSKIPLEIMEVNSTGMKNVLDFVLKHNARLLHTSTSEVYGDPLEHPQKESYFGNVNTLGPRSCYDEGKRFAESLIFHFALKHPIEYRIVRIFNTYGPHMNPADGRVIPNFVHQAKDNKPVTVYGDGSQTRSFCYVSDMVAGIRQLMKTEENPGPVNIGNPTEITITQLAEKIIEMMESSSEISYTPIQADDPKVRRPDISKAESHFKYAPTVSLDEGLSKTISWFMP